MPVTSADITALSSPIPIPTALGDRGLVNPQIPFTSNQQQVNMALSGVTPDPGVQPAIGSGNTMLQSSLDPAASQGGISGKALYEVGGNVAGLVGQQEEAADKYETYIPETPDPMEEQMEEQISEFVEADEEGVIEGNKITKGKKAARKLKRKDRREDRQARKDAGLKGSDKRRMRKAQRQSRKASWQAYKGEMDLKAQEEMLDL